MDLSISLANVLRRNNLRDIGANVFLNYFLSWAKPDDRYLGHLLILRIVPWRHALKIFLVPVFRNLAKPLRFPYRPEVRPIEYLYLSQSVLLELNET